MTVSEGEWDPETLMQTFMSDGFYEVENYIFKGNDQIIGTAGSEVLAGFKGRDTILGGKGGDWIEGGRGNDRLTGGPGSDRFDFFAHGGHDVITDFDAIGGGKKQDYLRLSSILDYHEKHTNHGLLLKFDTGESLLLLDVDKLDKNDVSFL